MYSFSKDQTAAAIIALTGCVATFLVPTDASAFSRAGRGGSFHAASHAAFHARPTFRPSVQPRRTFQFHATSFRRPTVHTSNPVRIGGVARPATFRVHFPSAGSLGNRFPHTMSVGTSFPHLHPAGLPSSRVSFLPGPHTIGAGIPHLGGFGSSGRLAGLQHLNGNSSSSNLINHLPKPNSIGTGQIANAGVTHPVICIRAPCPSHLPTGPAGGNQKQTDGTKPGTKPGNGSTTNHPPIECIRAPCPTHLPTGPVANKQNQGDDNSAGGSRGPFFPKRHPGGTAAASNTDDGSNAGGDNGAASSPVVSTTSSPVQVASTATTYSAPSAVRRQVSSTPTQAPAAEQAAPQSVFVVFQQNLSAADLAAFLQAYKVSIAEGPSAEGVYKLRVDTSLAGDQLQQMVDSMKSQDNIVSAVSLN